MAINNSENVVPNNKQIYTMVEKIVQPTNQIAFRIKLMTRHLNAKTAKETLEYPAVSKPYVF